MEPFHALCAELEDGNRLSVKYMPGVEIVALLENMRAACEDQTHPLREAAGASNLVDGVANVRPAETLAGVLDGRAVVCLVIAFRLFEHDEKNVSTRRKAAELSNEELDIVCESTDTNPLSREDRMQKLDPDPVQKALRAFLSGEPLETCECALAAAAYRLPERYASLPELGRTAADFLHDCSMILQDEGCGVEEPRPPRAEEEETSSESRAEALARIAANRVAMVDKSTSTEDFYAAAEHPFAGAHFSAGASAPPTPAPAPPKVPAEAPSVPAEAPWVPEEAPWVPKEAPWVPKEAPWVPKSGPTASLGAPAEGKGAAASAGSRGWTGAKAPGPPAAARGVAGTTSSSIDDEILRALELL